MSIRKAARRLVKKASHDVELQFGEDDNGRSVRFSPALVTNVGTFNINDPKVLEKLIEDIVVAIAYLNEELDA